MDNDIPKAGQRPDIAQLRKDILAVLADLEKAQRRAVLEPRFNNLTPIDDVGKLIKSSRKKQNLSIADLANLTGIAFSTIQKIESKGSSARLDTLTKVLGALGLTLWIG
jgi:ribosome-binding protein aMBF1 (putative translation factor)